MFDDKKKAQAKIIESFEKPYPVTKEAIMNILDEQISHLPELDQQRYIIYLRSAEHPDGYKLGMEARPVFRLKSDTSAEQPVLSIIRDSGQNPDSFFWDEATYAKMCKKAENRYFIGTTTGQYLEAFAKLYGLMNLSDARVFANKVAACRNPLEVLTTPAEERLGIFVTKELADVLSHKLLESYNDWDENATSPVEEGDLLILDGEYYYRVDAKLAAETYRKGSLN